MAPILRIALLLPLAFSLVAGLSSAQACEKHLRGHSGGSDSSEQTSQR